MSSCRNCSYLKGNACQALEIARETYGRPVNPLAGCIIPIVDSYCQLIEPGMKILEIGCGAWSPVAKRTAEVGAQFEGIDTEASYYGRPTVATRIENLASLSFEDATFDYVFGNQTMEHWGEHGCNLAWGLLQAFRVCRVDGWVMMNVPIHFHGTREFVHGDFERLHRLFSMFSSNLQFTEWRRPADPLEVYLPHPNYWSLKKSPAYLLDIRAQRNKPLPSGLVNRVYFGARIQRWLNYSPSYNLYRALEKVGLLPKTAE